MLFRCTLVFLLIIFIAVFFYPGNKEEKDINASLGVVRVIGDDSIISTCVGVMLSRFEVVTARHCLNSGQYKALEFESYNGFKYPLADLSLGNNDSFITLSKFNNDVVFLRSFEEIVSPNIALISYDDFSDFSELVYLGKVKGKLGFVTCDYSKSIDFDLRISSDCVLPQGKSGTPLFLRINEQLVIVGIYHGFMNVNESSYGVISLAKNWNIRQN